MKKISLSSVKEFLTRDEMRAVSGGSGSCYECISNIQCQDCNMGPCIWHPGGYYKYCSYS